MLDPWELLLHHSYTGTAGVVFDSSPKGGGHGRTAGLRDEDFEIDGAAPGSGAIATGPGRSVRVDLKEAWAPLMGVRCEFVCRNEVPGGGGTLIDADSFSFGIGSGGAHYGYSQVSHGSGAAFGPISSAGGSKTVPSHEWITLSFYYNGPYGHRVTLNGVDILGSDSGWMDTPLKGTHRVSIGSRLDGSEPWTGRIDDVKIYRLDPHWVDKSFTNRPFDPRVSDCWANWSKSYGTALRDETECAQHIDQLLRTVLDGVLRRVMTGDPAVRARWLAAALRYQELWSQGDLDGVAATMTDMLAEIGGELRLSGDPAVQALLEDECVRRFTERLPKVDCDPQFVELIKKTMQSV